ncbi:hypothetical protein BHE90_002856 [Fusarium euwallaceae]|uniref:AAA+ ATPase domain-containing protein n=1 Tax=Fusarium euwallaceae TaxID=1147111 RepID=A0A430M3K5_9HYPO|nr:hypothetical protein BHE90_002856 [Fusarium euwallaceae]
MSSHIHDPAEKGCALSIKDVPSLSTTLDSLIPPPASPPGSPSSAPSPSKLVDSESPDPSQGKEGSQCAIQTLYEGPPKCKCCINWVEAYPDDLRMAVEEEAETKQKALVVRMSKNHDDEKPLTLHSIIVQNASLKQTLGQVFEGYRGITTSLKKLVFKTPFRPFHFRWKQLAELLEYQKQHDRDAAAYTQLLYGVLHDELHEQMAKINDLLDHGVITYNRFWNGDEHSFIAIDCQYNDSEKQLVVTAKYIDWDGERFGYAPTCLKIHEFSGTRKLSELEVYPASLLQSPDETRSRLISRGKKFHSLNTGVHHRAYSGRVTFTDAKRDNDGQLYIEERVMVDAAAYFDLNSGKRLRLEPLDSTCIVPEIRVADDTHIDSSTGPRSCSMMSMMPVQPHLMAKIRGDVDSGSLLPRGSLHSKPTSISGYLTDEQFLVCHSKVRGYSLKTKFWCLFDVDHLSDITWNNDVFSQLLLPPVYKSLMLSFVEGRATNEASFDDIVEGKGLGIIILLLGSPGTGKTLTAETVAEEARKPLYLLSAGELGQDPAGIESRLRLVFKIAESWNAIVLLDECDVFLRERSSNELTHNEIVAVFLRELEYYRGLLVMTSNSDKPIDPAFKSRIDLTLHYPELDKATREQIWRRFATKAGSRNALDDSSYERLSRLPMNGREIRNAVKISMLWAAREEKELGLEQIRTVLQVSREAGDSGLEVLDAA